MRTPTRRLDPAEAWAPYGPTPDAPWDLARVAHLHRRAGFTAPWRTLQRDLADGPSASVDRLLKGGPDAEFDAQMDAMAAPSGTVERARAAWLYRLIQTPHPLRERMTLFWHDHFATSDAKVNNPGGMVRQNALLREHALGDFRKLLTAMARDPAMLVWLDATTNRKEHPNENYAREVMELFALGRGHYTEKDVQEAARAFTGTYVQADHYIERPAQHDDGVKTVLGRSGNLRGDDIAGILLEQPACADFLAGKLYRHFIDEIEEPTPDLLSPLADVLRRSDYDLGATMAVLVRSRIFFDAAHRRRRVKSPVEFAVGTIRALEILDPTVSADALAASTSAMGQALYAPPSVAGWGSGSAWINTSSSLSRANFALGLLGTDGPLGGRFDPEKLAKRHGAGPTFYVDLLVQDALDESVKRRLGGSAREAASLLLTSPEYQLA